MATNLQQEVVVYNYAVVGGGIAAVSCVEQILEYDSTAIILLISSASVVKEARNIIHLTKTLQDFVLVEKSLKSFKDVHQSVNVVHDSVVSMDVDAHSLITVQGHEFKYKKCCICTGARPKMLFPQQSSPFILGIRDTDSVLELGKRVGTARRVLVIGNGGIATEFVHEVDGVEIFWVIKDKSISAQFVDPGAAQFFIKARIEEKERVDDDDNESSAANSKRAKTEEDSKPKAIVTKRQQYTLMSCSESDKKMVGVSEPGSALGPDWHRELHLRGLQAQKNFRIFYNTEVSEVIPSTDLESPKQENWPIWAKLSDGQIVGADLIISATGVLPNCELTKNSCQQDEEKGIFVDSAMRTSAKDVFAAGDVCFPNWKWAKHWFQMRLWTQARQMGLYAGKSMYFSYLNDLKAVDIESVSETQEIEPDFCFEIFSHATKFFGFKVVLLGLYNGQGLDPSKLELLIRCTNGVEYIKLVMQEGKLQGAVLIGDTGLEETFENLILNQVDLTPYGEDLLNPDIDIEDYFD